ncbi:MAG TPA: hypothetical protein VMG10_17360 [Gemmataceae bacterium]|nr:hypothetical protein [Gemmataceae bacterium]
MQVRESDPSHIVVDLSRNELILLNNSLNEVCHGLSLPDFATRLGAGWDELEALRRQINAALEKMAKRLDEG